jgi:thioredoxin 1
MNFAFAGFYYLLFEVFMISAASVMIGKICSLPQDKYRLTSLSIINASMLTAISIVIICILPLMLLVFGYGIPSNLIVVAIIVALYIVLLYLYVDQKCRRIAVKSFELIKSEIVEIQRSLKNNPQNAASCCRLGELYEQIGRGEDAVRYYEAANSIYPEIKLTYKITSLKTELAKRNGIVPDQEAVLLCTKFRLTKKTAFICITILILIVLVGISLVPDKEEDNFNLTEKTFSTKVLDSNLPVMIDFWSPRCADCFKIDPIIREVISEYAGKLSVYKVNLDNNNQLMAKYEVDTIPTLFLFKNGAVVDKIIGADQYPKEEIKKRIDEVVQNR